MKITVVPPGGLTGPEVDEAAAMLASLVAGGAALGWVDPPSRDEVARLLDEAITLVVAEENGHIAGLGYWRRYERPTHSPHADVEKVAVDPAFQGRGVGRQIMTELISAARAAGVEMLTLDLRGDNLRAAALYESLGFRQYGRLERFVAVGERRWDKLLYVLDLTR